MSKKLTKRERYVLKWIGPRESKNISKYRRSCKAQMGRGNEDDRVFTTAFFCRFQGWYPASTEELYRLAGIPS